MFIQSLHYYQLLELSIKNYIVYQNWSNKLGMSKLVKQWMNESVNEWISELVN